VRPGLEEFAGVWRLERQINDNHGARLGTLNGMARFAADGTGLTYNEEGKLVLPGSAPLAAGQGYLWRPDPGGIAVLFTDERPFHLIAPGLAPKAEHICGADLYRVAYDFSGWPEWTATWRVIGPRKDYRMTSRYRPATIAALKACAADPGC